MDIPKLGTLIWVWRHYRDELVADFQEHFGLDIEVLGSECSVSHAASLITQLPGEARVRAAYTADNKHEMNERKYVGNGLPPDELREWLAKPRKAIVDGRI